MSPLHALSLAGFTLLDHPLLLFPAVVLGLFLAGLGAALLQTRYAMAVDAGSASFKTLESAVLGLLALLLGFNFSMAVSRYDLRRGLQVEEANAIGTTWLRSSALDESSRTLVRGLLKQYVPARIAFFDAGTDARAIDQSLSRAGAIQDELWRLGNEYAKDHRDPYSSLFVASLNETFDASEKRTAALENRIPGAAWVLLLFISGAACGLVGLGTTRKSRVVLLVLPVVVGAALMLILDIDSPRSGLVRVPQSSMERVAGMVGQ